MSKSGTSYRSWQAGRRLRRHRHRFGYRRPRGRRPARQTRRTKRCWFWNATPRPAASPTCSSARTTTGMSVCTMSARSTTPSPPSGGSSTRSPAAASSGRPWAMFTTRSSSAIERFEYVAGRTAWRDRMVESFPDEEAAIDRYLELVKATTRGARSFFGAKALPGPIAAIAGPFDAPRLSPPRLEDRRRGARRTHRQ